MPANFQLRIVTPEKVLFAGEVASIKAPGSEGSFGVLAKHAPMVAALCTGEFDYVENGARHHLATSGGFVEVSAEGVTVLAETAEFGQKIDVSRAEAARDRARQRLGDPEYDRLRAQASLERALNRMRVAHISA